MGCFVFLFALISPRLALFFIWIFSDLLSRAFDAWFVPFIGFFILPWTTLAWAAVWAPVGGVGAPGRLFCRAGMVSAVVWPLNAIGCCDSSPARVLPDRYN